MRLWWPCALAMLLGLLVYTSSFPGAFHFDDWPLLLENPDVTGPTFDYRFFLTHYGGRPLTLWTFHWNFKFAGSDPLVFHSVNLFLHLAAVAVLYVLVYLEVSLRRELAFLSAVIFAIHPLQTQAVNYVWSRSVLLMSLFGLLSALLIRRRPWLGLLAFQLAVWSRAEALAVSLLLFHLAPRRWRPVAAVALANASAFLWGFSRTAPAEVGWNYPDALGYWVAQPIMFWKYVRLMIWPSGLAIDHFVGEVSPAAGGIAAAALIAVCVALAKWRTRRPALFFAGLCLLVPMIPSWMIPNSDWFNESRAYLSMAGFSLLVSLLLCALPDRRQRVLAGTIVVSALAVTSFQRNLIWNDEIAVWRDAAEKSPSKARTHYNLGSALARQGHVDEARSEFRRALDLNPSDDMSYAALGFCAEFKGDRISAADHYSKALELNPENRYAREGLDRTAPASPPGSSRPPQPLGKKPSFSLPGG